MKVLTKVSRAVAEVVVAEVEILALTFYRGVFHGICSLLLVCVQIL